MGMIGNQPANNFLAVTKDTFNGNASSYTLSKAATTNGVAVFVENVRQIPTTAYSVSGTTLTFTGTTPAGTGNVYVLHHNTPASTATHPATQALTATSGTFTGAFTSPGIDDNADAVSLTIDTSENVTLNSGNLVIGTSGKGIDFTATGDGAGTDSSELLDDYEEGTWTATATAYSGTFSASDEQYVKVGRMVHFDCVLSFSGSDSSRLTIAGLPYTATNTSGVAKYFAGGAYSDLMMLVSGTTLVGGNTGGDATYTSVSGMTARFSGTYMATA